MTTDHDPKTPDTGAARAAGLAEAQRRYGRPSGAGTPRTGKLLADDHTGEGASGCVGRAAGLAEARRRYGPAADPPGDAA